MHTVVYGSVGPHYRISQLTIARINICLFPFFCALRAYRKQPIHLQIHASMQTMQYVYVRMSACKHLSVCNFHNIGIYAIFSYFLEETSRRCQQMWTHTQTHTHSQINSLANFNFNLPFTFSLCPFRQQKTKDTNLHAICIHLCLFPRQLEKIEKQIQESFAIRQFFKHIHTYMSTFLFTFKCDC